MSHKLIHTSPVRELAERRVEILPSAQIRVGLWRGSPGSTDPSDFVLTSGFSVSVEDARELRSALALAIAEIEASDAE